MEITLRDFVLDEALGGASVCWAKDDDKSKGFGKYAYDFKREGVGYTYRVESKKYNCNKEGNPVNGGHQLFMADSVIEETRGTAASRGDAEDKETIEISALQPREQFALAAMQVILGKLTDPLTCNDFTIQLIAEQSFKVAQAMLTKAAEVRAETKEPEEDTAIDIDSNNVTDTTDKILYNMQDLFKKQVEEIKSIKSQLTLIAEDVDTIAKKE